MKRKLSLLMAAVMALSALPFTATEVSAQSTNRLTNLPGSTVPNNTVFVEMEPSGALNTRSVVGHLGGSTTGSQAINTAPTWGTGGYAPLGPSQNVPYAVRAGYLELELQGAAVAGHSFRLDLSNAEWFFRAGSNSLSYLGGLNNDPQTGNLIDRLEGMDLFHRGTSVVNAGQATFGARTTSTSLTPTVPANESWATSPMNPLNDGTGFNNFRGLLNGTQNLATSRSPLRGWASGNGQADDSSALGYHRIGLGLQEFGRSLPMMTQTYDPRRGVFVPDTPGNMGTYVRFGRWGSSPMTTAERNSVPIELEIPYTMNISETNPNVATVVLAESQPARTGGVNADRNWLVRIPLAVRLTSSDDVTVTVVTSGHTASVTPGTHFLVSASGVSTTAHVVDPVTARDRFPVERLVIQELRANSIRRTTGTRNVNNNAFDLVLPPGFYFEDNLDALQMTIEEGLRWPNGAAGWATGNRPTGNVLQGSRTWPIVLANSGTGFGENPVNGNWNIFFPDGYENNRSRLRVRMNDFQESHDQPGTISILGLVIWAEETAPYDVDINIAIENTNWLGLNSGWTNATTTTDTWVTEPVPAGWQNFPADNRPGGAPVLTMPAGWVPGPGIDGLYRFAGNTTGDGTFVGFRYLNEETWRRAWFGSHDPANGAALTLRTGTSAADLAENARIAAIRNAAATITVGNRNYQLPFNPATQALRDTTTGLREADYNQSNMVTAMSVRAGSRRDWEVRLSTQGTIPQLISGRYESPTSQGHVDHQTARAVFEEIVPNSWWAGRQVILSLPEDVKWRRVFFVEVSGTAQTSVTEDWTYVNIDPPTGNLQLAGGNTVVAAAGQGAQRGVRFDANQMYWTDVLAFRAADQRNRRAYIRFDSWVSVAADFEGDIVLTASGSSVPETVVERENVTREGLPSAVIATAIPPVRVNVLNVTDTRIGYQWQPTADIVITETVPGALLRDRNVRLTVTDMVQIDTMFSPDVQIAVTNGNIAINNISTGLAGFLFPGGGGTAVLGVEANRGTISFDVRSQSSGAPSEITVSNVSIRVDRTVPETNDRPYKVVVWGTGIANNFGQFDLNPNISWPVHERTNNDRFGNNPGITEDYIRVVTGGDGSPWLTQEVRVAIGEMYYTVNGEPEAMDAPAFVDDVSNSTFVPLRFIANAFGLHDDRSIVWDDHARTATLTLPTGRVVQFQADSSIMLDNGVPRTIENAAGQPISPRIETVGGDGGGRMYLPFRFLGEVVFGVEVGWEQATQTAIFNPGGHVTSN